jgi:DNA-binding beta-propeller fold protein YncE
MTSIVNPNPIAVDANGIVYISNYAFSPQADNSTNTILKFDSVPKEFVGLGTFNSPMGIVYYNNALFVLDRSNFMIRKIALDGTVTTFAGNSGPLKITDGTGTAANFKWMTCITVDPSGNMYVADDSGRVIRKITSSGVVTTIQKEGEIEDVDVKKLEFDHIAVGSSETLYATATGFQCIFKLTLTGGKYSVTVFAGDISESDLEGDFEDPEGIVVGKDGNLYLADAGKNRICKITPEGVVSTLIETGVYPKQLAIHPTNDTLYVVEGSGDRLKIKTVIGSVATVLYGDRDTFSERADTRRGVAIGEDPEEPEPPESRSRTDSVSEDPRGGRRTRPTRVLMTRNVKKVKKSRKTKKRTTYRKNNRTTRKR